MLPRGSDLGISVWLQLGVVLCAGIHFFMPPVFVKLDGLLILTNVALGPFRCTFFSSGVK